MRIQRCVLERMAQVAIDAESAKPNRDVLLVFDAKRTVQALQGNEHIQVVPMPEFVAPEMEQHAEPRSRAIKEGSLEWWATRLDVLPPDEIGRAFIALLLVVDERTGDKLKELFSDRWKEQLVRARALQEHMMGAPAGKEFQEVIVGETNRERQLMRTGRL